MYLIYVQHHNVFSTALWAEDPFASNSSHGCQGRCFTIAGAADFEMKGSIGTGEVFKSMSTHGKWWWWWWWWWWCIQMYAKHIHLYAYMRWVQFDFLSNQMICIQCCIDLTMNLWQIESVFARYWSFRQSVEHGNVGSVEQLFGSIGWSIRKF